MQYKRKKLIIKRRFQFKLMSRIFISTVILLALCAGTIFYINSWSLDRSIERVNTFLSDVTFKAKTDPASMSGLKMIDESQRLGTNIIESLDKLKETIVLAFLITMVVALIIVATVFLIISHRIAGPIYRFEQTLNAYKDGDLSIRVHLRKHDELKDLADAFNGMGENLNQKMKEIQAELISLQEKLESPKLKDEEKKAIEESIKIIEKQVQFFRLTYS